ncbi:MAG: RnfABCDGE type electron transport complex subunit D [Spirochaetota bacterium]
MAEGKKRPPLIMKQRPMIQVVYALIPLAVASIYFFGWRSLVVLATVNIAGFLAEYIFSRVYKQSVSSAVFVTNFLFALSLPPVLPLWIAVVGIVFGVVFGKMVFGGFGKNVFNPALSGRAFIYVSFGVPMTSAWIMPADGPAGGFARWTSDAVSSATPLVKLAGGESVPLLNLLLGNVSGSLGETSAVLIILAGLYLMIRKVSNFRIVLAGTAAFLVFQTILWLAGAAKVYDPLGALLAGSFLYGIMFMATDPVSASQTTDAGRWIFGALIGVLCVLIRSFSTWPEGVTFAILIANMFAPLLDYVIKKSKKKVQKT